MIRFLSDLHGGQDICGLEEYAACCTKDDLLILLGDIGLHLYETEENRAFTEYFKALPCRIAFIDGNHENFDYLYSFPQEDWNGGRVHRISENIVHLMRGYVFELEGSTFFTMGGCKSSQKWMDAGIWWPQEEPTAEEIGRGLRNLEAHGRQVDHILTHNFPIAPVEADPLTLDGLLNFIRSSVTYRHWYAGHWHQNKELDAKHTIVYDRLIPLCAAE